MAPGPSPGEGLFAFAALAALIEITPGPNMVYLTLVSARRGRAAGFATVIGVTLGLATYLVATAVGLAELAMRAPWLLQALRAGGVAYLLWLAIEAWRDGAGPSSAEVDGGGRARLALRGYLVNLLNPKALVFYVLLLPGFLDPGQSMAPQVLMLGSVHLVISVAVHSSLVLLGAAGHRRLVQALRSRVVRAGFALALVGTAVWVAWTSRGMA